MTYIKPIPIDGGDRVEVGDIWEYSGTTDPKEQGIQIEITESNDDGVSAVEVLRPDKHRMWCYAKTVIEYWTLIKRPGSKPKVDRSRYPHQCPRCTAPAYRGAFSVDCTNSACPTRALTA